MSKVLVTGGAGYIGSHTVKKLGEAGYEIVIYDNLSTGSADAILHGELVQGDLSNIERLSQVFADDKFDAVLHFAESTEIFVMYFKNWLEYSNLKVHY